jgi:hypothetical protein
MPVLVRKLDLSTFTGDVWATIAGQAEPPADVPRLRVLGGPVRWRAVPMDGMGDEALQVADATTTVDAVAVKLTRGPRGQLITTPLTPVSVITGGEVNVPDDFTEDDVSSHDTLALAIPTITVGSAAALWIWAEGGIDEDAL